MATLQAWARESLAPLYTVSPDSRWEDLTPVGRMIGDATVVALSEGVHGGKEPLEFRHRLFQYLVQEKGFTTIAIEASGIVESRCIHEYVRDGASELDAALVQGHSFGFEQFPQTRALVQWMREYNASASNPRKINFYGLDMAGVLATDHPYFAHDVPLRKALEFLGEVDEAARQAFQSRFEFFLNVRFNARQHLEEPTYGQLSQAERDTLTAAIADLIVWLERHEGPYTAAGTSADYAWASQAAVAARQMDSFLRQCPLGWVPPSGEAMEADSLEPFHVVMSDVRDRAWAENLDWILEQEGAGAKVLIFGARYHISAAPLKVSWHPHRQVRQQHVAGTYLRRRFADRLVTIGNVIGQGDASFQRAEDLPEHHLKRAPADSLDGMAAAVGTPLFMLDLRQASSVLAEELNREHALVAQSQTLRLPPRQAFDLLLYIDTVSRAVA